MQSTVPSRWGERVSKLYSPATWQHILQLGSAASYTFNPQAPLTDTMDSHRLALLAEQQGHQKAVVHEVSRRYFEEGIPLADRASLLEVAEMCGVTGAREFLDSDAGTAEVMQSVKAHQEAGIHSIPVPLPIASYGSCKPADLDVVGAQVALISSGNFSTTVRGSASPEEFLAVFRQIEQHWAAA